MQLAPMHNHYPAPMLGVWINSSALTLKRDLLVTIILTFCYNRLTFQFFEEFVENLRFVPA